MSVAEAIAVFFSSLALSVVSSVLLSRRLNQAGTWLGFSAALLGLVTALGTDAPEISSALSAILSGQHDLGLGVILGSNIFNLAALLGLSALIAGRIRVSRPGVLLNAGVCLWITLTIAAQVDRRLDGLAAGILVASAVIPYFVLVVLSPRQVRRLAGPGQTTEWMLRAVSGVRADARKGETPPKPEWADLLDIVPLLVMIVLASVGLVHAASLLGDRLGISQTVVGTLVLAPLTGIPDLVAAILLTRDGRGAAVVSETFNSNGLNLFFGAFLPAITIGLRAPTAQSMLAAWWLIAMTLAALIWSATRRGLRWPAGAALIGIYAAFALVIVIG